MKWFSVLALGLLSVCGIGFAQDTSTFVVKAPPPRLRTVNYPEANVFFTQTGNMFIIPLGTTVPPTRLFSVAEDGLTFSIDQSGFFLPTLRITPIWYSSFAGILNIVFEKKEGGNWSNISAGVGFSFNTLNRLEFNPMELVAGSQYRLVVKGFASSIEWEPIYFQGGQEGLRLDLRYLNNYTP